MTNDEQYYEEDKRPLREQLEKDVERFLKNGGEITQVESMTLKEIKIAWANYQKQRAE